ncbi:hypothetical protein AN964_11690 [Heyndrickxia shackletonii]|uniref:Uncharacterized protein n=1 Tax=Heyndrickxia shackletonii TaxID=157838 RepID=A0A0Q3WYA3_9BACI|nr:hypothetical protein AN964_11690 [Heyndrickxia shackletonii]
MKRLKSARFAATAINAVIQKIQVPKNAGVQKKLFQTRYLILFLQNKGGRRVFVKVVWKSISLRVQGEK